MTDSPRETLNHDPNPGAVSDDAREPSPIASPEDPPPTPPREITAHVRRVAWQEPRVRFWLVVMVALTGIAIYFAIVQYINWSREAKLVRDGLVVNAIVEEAVGPLSGKRIPPELPVAVKYTIKGENYREEGMLPVPQGFYRNGGPITLHVDPENPHRWTNRATVPSLAREMLPATLLIPAIIGAMLAWLWFHWRVYSVWQRGVAEPAIVLETRHTALAPRSRVVRCSPRDRRDKIIVTVFVPQRLARLHNGDTLWIINMPHNPWRAIAAMVYMR